MLLAHPPELDARLPREFAGMDIKDLIKHENYSTKQLRSLSDLFNNDYASGHERQMLSSSQGTLSHPAPSMPQLGMRRGSTSDLRGIHPSHATNAPARPILAQTHSSHAGLLDRGSSIDASPHQQNHEWPRYLVSNKRSSPPEDAEEGPPTKKSSTKWNTEENRQIIKLRGQGMKWSDISRHIPGRTGLACRLHYQNYLEKRGEWDEEKKNKLARVYER